MQRKTCSIRFLVPRGHVGFLSNYAEAPFVLDGRRFVTVEHYYQVQKFPVEMAELRDQIANAAKPGLAKYLAGRMREFWRPDWESIKDEVMTRALAAKFGQNPELLAKLQATRGRLLIEANKTDSYWGIGENESGRNRLGELLMQLRDSV